MKQLRALLTRLTGLFGNQRRDRELAEEIDSHLQLHMDDNLRAGMTPQQARRDALLKLGGVESTRRAYRERSTLPPFENLLQDIRLALRQLVHNPGFSAAAILVLALGMGANTAVFTLVHAVLLKSLPVAHPDQLYRIGEGEEFCCEWGGLQDSWGIFDYPFYQHIRDTAPSFSQVAAFSGNTPSFNVRRAGSSAAARTLDGEYVSGNYFATLGIPSSVGRLLSPADDTPQSSPSVVMSHRMWQLLYNADPTIVGSTLLINGLPVTLVGIAPPGFYGDRLAANPPELWIPLNQEPAFEGQGVKSILHSSGMAWLYMIGRLNPGQSPASAQAQLSTDLQQWLWAQGRGDGANRARIPKQQIRLTPGGTGISPFRSNVKNGLYLLSAASVLVLLIACANLANLLLARGASRRHQTALRISLGAPRSRLIRAALTESVLLSLAGGSIGLLVAFAATKAILLIVFRGASLVPVDASPSLPVLGFAFAMSVLTAIVFGIAPAWIGTHADPSESLRDNSRSATSPVSRPQKILVILQAAFSVVLLAVAGLVTQSLRNLEQTNLGFQTQGRLVATLSFKAAGYTPPQLPAAYREIQERLERIPGVRSASLSLNGPQNLCCINLNILIGGRSESWIENVNIVFTRVSPHYFETIGTPLLRGRAINQYDTPSSAHVAVVDESFAHRFFPGQDPLGKRFGLSLPGHGYDYEIVGVVKNTKYRNPGANESPMVFLPFTQSTVYEVAGYQRLEVATQYAQLIELNVTGAPESYEAAFREALAAVNPNLSVITIRNYSEIVALEFNQQRLIARLTGVFGLLALLLASVGLYGVTAYNVTRRTAEIGIRMALGANRRDVVRLVLRSAVSQVGIGLGIGIPLAILSGRALAHQLYGVARFDPWVLGGSTLALGCCALVAALLPARRAVSIEPITALRNE